MNADGLVSGDVPDLTEQMIDLLTRAHIVLDRYYFRANGERNNEDVIAIDNEIREFLQRMRTE